eukprot:10573-Heterococcus_DN1.PRE.4
MTLLLLPSLQRCADDDIILLRHILTSVYASYEVAEVSTNSTIPMHSVSSEKRFTAVCLQTYTLGAHTVKVYCARMPVQGSSTH